MGLRFAPRRSRLPVASCASSTASPVPIGRKPMARPNASFSRHSGNGPMASPIVGPPSVPPCSNAGRITTTGIAHTRHRRIRTHVPTQSPQKQPVDASQLVASIADAGSFKNGRQVAAWLGLVPKQDSSGGKPKLLGMSKRGDPSNVADSRRALGDCGGAAQG